MATVNTTPPRPKFIDRRRVLKFSHEFCSNVEKEFNLFLGKQLKPIMEKQTQLTNSTGYRVRDQVFLLPYSGLPEVWDVGALPKRTTRPEALDPSLGDAHAAWMELYETHLKGWDRVRAGLGSLIAKAETEQDWRDMFPEHVIQPSLGHDYLQKSIIITNPDGSRTSLVEPLQRSRPPVYPAAPGSNNPWPMAMQQIYARIATHVDTYIGFKFI